MPTKLNPGYLCHLKTVELCCPMLFQTVVVAHLLCTITLPRAMTPKPSLPLYHHKERAKLSRRKNGSYFRRRSRGHECLWIFGILCLVLVVGIGLGLIIGIELTHIPPSGLKEVRSKESLSGIRDNTGMSPRLGEMSGASKRDAPGSPGPRGRPDSGSSRRDYESPTVRGVTISDDGAKWLSQHSFRSRRQAYVKIRDSLDQPEKVTVMAWVQLESSGRSRDIKTILANKPTGCDSNARGYALYVNEWEQSDGKLWLEWVDSSGGCQKVSSDVQIPVSRWVHVAARFDGYEAAIFMNGREVGKRALSWRPRGREEFTIGAFSNGDFSFEGRISAMAAFDGALTGDQIEEIARESGGGALADAVECSSVTDGGGSLVIGLQLDDAVEEEKDMMGLRVESSAVKADVQYHFPYFLSMDHGLQNGLSDREITDEMRRQSDEKGRERAKFVKAAMKHAWDGYVKYAFGADELGPISHRGKENWGGMGVTLVDSLDTLWLMGLRDEFKQAQDWVARDLTFNNAHEVSVFETTIRELGGLLAAYDLSRDPVFKDKARQLGDKLLPAFDSSSGMPMPKVNFRTGNGSGSRSNIAEVGTLQVEFRYLSYITGDPKYANKVNKVFELMEHSDTYRGLYAINVNTNTGHTSGSQVTFGALGDSFYEYLLKAWIQGGQKEEEAFYRRMYDDAIDGMHEVLLKGSDPSGLAFVSDWSGHSNDHKMDHLVCFLPGTLALGSITTKDKKRAERDLSTAKALAYTCYQMYARQATGLAPEMVRFESGRDMVVPPKAAYNILRPETAEALYMLHEITRDPIYREWSWEIFQAFEKYCKLPVAYGSYPNVNNVNAGLEDRMESFFLGETLKYLYLIQDPENEVDITKVVFNTEAHPMHVFGATTTSASAVITSSS